MAHRYDHLREKAIWLRTERRMTIDEIVERLKLPKTTVYYWTKDIPIPRTEKQSEAQRQKALLVRAKYAALREKAYEQGLAEAPGLLKEPTFRDFVVLYMAEGYKRNRNEVSIGNSDPAIVTLAHSWIKQLTNNKIGYQLQSHVDHDDNELKAYWAALLGIESERIVVIRKSNSGHLSGRQFRSVYGVFTVRVGDTALRAPLQAWMDIVKAEW